MRASYIPYNDSPAMKLPGAASKVAAALRAAGPRLGATEGPTVQQQLDNLSRNVSRTITLAGQLPAHFRQEAMERLREVEDAINMVGARLAVGDLTTGVAQDAVRDIAEELEDVQAFVGARTSGTSSVSAATEPGAAITARRSSASIIDQLGAPTRGLPQWAIWVLVGLGVLAVVGGVWYFKSKPRKRGRRRRRRR